MTPTVESHGKHIYLKLEIASRVELRALALRDLERSVTHSLC